MTTYTNRLRLPLPVYNLTVDISTRYSKGDADISVTSLIGEPLPRILEREHKDELVEDVVDCQHRMIGTILHTFLAEAEPEPEQGALHEQRLFIEVGGWTISGEPDHYSGQTTKVLTDYKYTAKYKTRSETPEEWIKQQNIYKYMLKQYDREVDKMQFCVWQRDAYENAGDDFIRMIPCYEYTEQQVVDYLLKRVAYHQVSDPNYNELIDLSCVPECSEKARYHKPPVYALMKTGRKGAVKLHDSREKAEAHKKENGDTGYWIQERGATNGKCDKYCKVAKWCQYQQARIKARGEDSDKKMD